ncbi:MAG: glycosyltransferase family 4 protein [Rhodanobacteraceae bacterium]
MAAPQGILYYGGGDVGGYGQAAIANVRALVNLGIPVRWVPLEWTPQSMRPSTWATSEGKVRPLLNQRGENGNLADMLALIEHTSRAIDYDTIVAHSPPEMWPQVFQTGKRNVGCTAWETDRAPAHWLPLLRRADCVIVPCANNRQAFLRSGLRVPIAVIPHIRRHRWPDFTPSERVAAREDLGIRPGNRVFYSISAWDPRKALPDLIRTYATAFMADEPVSLLIKTGRMGHDEGPLYPRRPARDLATRAITRISAQLQRPPPHVVLHDEEVDADSLDLIHAVGDVYVSLSRGEGWGLGAFEAATLGKPVVMTAWGGQTEFLGTDWPGAVPCRMTPAPLWAPQQPSFFPSQRWAEPDQDTAARLLRAVFTDPAPAQDAAISIRERIFREFSEPVVANRWLEVLSA